MPCMRRRAIMQGDANGRVLIWVIMSAHLYFGGDKVDLHPNVRIGLKREAMKNWGRTHFCRMTVLLVEGFGDVFRDLSEELPEDFWPLD